MNPGISISKTYEARFLIIDVRRNDLATVVWAVHSESEPSHAYGSVLIAAAEYGGMFLFISLDKC